MTGFIFSVSKIFLVMTMIFVALPPGTAHALEVLPEGPDLPKLESFVQQLQNGQAGELRGLYIPGLLAAPVVQQPPGISEFVSPRDNIVTQYAAATRLGSIGLMAHNYLAGQDFLGLTAGQVIYLVYGDGRIVSYVISDLMRYQAVDPLNPSSRFVNLTSERGSTVSASELFETVYARPGRVIFQTCITVGQDLNWGRLFVIAREYDTY